MPEITYKKFKHYLLALSPFIFFIVVSIFLYIYITPEKLVSYVGAENAYLLMFVIAFIGGLTTLNGVPYFSILIVLASGGLNPVLLGLCSAFGVMLGDSTSYYVGYKGGTIVSPRIQWLSTTIRKVMDEHQKAFQLFCFLYGSVSPFSNDFISLSAGLARYPFFKMMIPLSLGNLVFSLTLAHLASNYDYLQNFSIFS